MRFSLHRRAVAAAAAGVLALVGIPTAAHAAVTTEASSAAECTVTEATLTWGFKESFRSYISGSIAHGSWEPIDGATYETPDFTWTGGTGTISLDGTAGTVTFPGGVHFTGHDGLLDTTIANPTVVLGAEPQLLLDVSGVSMESALSGDGAEAESAVQVPFATIAAGAVQVTTTDDTVTAAADGAATTITEDGFTAFGSYAAGTELDPVTFSLTAQCPVETPTPTPTTAEETATPVIAAGSTDADDAAPWGVFVGLGVVVAAVVGVGAYLIGRRRRPSGPAAEDGTPTNGGAAS